MHKWIRPELYQTQIKCIKTGTAQTSTVCCDTQAKETIFCLHAHIWPAIESFLHVIFATVMVWRCILNRLHIHTFDFLNGFMVSASTLEVGVWLMRCDLQTAAFQYTSFYSTGRAQRLSFNWSLKVTFCNLDELYLRLLWWIDIYQT